MASGTWRSRRQIQFAYDAIMAPIDDEFGCDELSGEWPGLDPHYADLPCYVPLIDEDGLDPFALDVPPVERH